ncbi:MAG: hypothetical protein JW927_22715 [Deltaproteobacteria bacterium]|nr:hypothetical protein [Deltaproteobacteria bacterium]
MKKNLINALIFVSFSLLCLLTICNSASASTGKMDSEGLIKVMDQYLNLLVKNNPEGLAIAKGVKITENGYPIKLGKGLFQTAKEITYKQYMADPSASQVMVFGVVKESMLLANFMVRLKVVKDKITEIETIVSRKDEASFANPEALKEPRPIYAKALSDSERSSRDKLIKIANSYFDGIEQNTGEIVPFHKECNRFENGTQTTNNPGTIATGCKEQFDNKVYAYITEVRDRRFLLADEEKGLVFGMFIFDMPGKREDFKYFPTPFDELAPRFYKPRSLLLAEMFKIVNGQIISIEAVMVNAPFGATSGW